MNFFRFLVPYLCASFVIQATIWEQIDISSRAVIRAPVVDLVLHLPLPDHSAASPNKISDGTCRRSHQALMNEVVRVVAEDDNNINIACDNVIYGIDPQTQQPLNSFWVPRHHLIFLKDLPQELLTAIPNPWNMPDSTLVLTRPWDIYSLGTRFVHAPEDDTINLYGIKLCDATHNKIHTLHVPKKYARLEVPLTNDQARTHFVQLAHAIIDHVQKHAHDEVIPYVWGGSSYLYGYKDNQFALKDGWERPGADKPYMGYDCSELILRLAQISGIPYTCKMTSIMSTLLHEITPQEPLVAGDLIWFAGHVMIVSSIENNQAIEARGYTSGYGKVQRLPLSECFLGITTYEQLREVAYSKTPVTHLKRDGSESSTIKEIKFYKLAH